MKTGRYFALFLVISLNFGLISAKDVDAGAFAKNFYEHFKTFFETNQTDSTLEQLRDDMINAVENSIKLIDFPIQSNPRVCLKCYVVAHSFIELTKSENNSDNDIKSFMKYLCEYAEIDNKYICNGNVDKNFPAANFIFGQKSDLTAESVCGHTMPEFYCMKKDETYEHALSIQKPILTESKRYDFTSSGNLTILQLSDFHYDQNYTVGSASICDTWVCCRGDQLPPDSNLPRAGFWGDYNACDSPGRLAENILQTVASLNKTIDIIYYTGDFADHFGWDNSRDQIKTEIRFVTDLIKRYLPNIPLFPILGNHEGYPANFFSPNYIEDNDISSKWLYEFVADEWKDYLTEEARLTLANTGYYTMLIKPKLRLVALNSNVGNVENLWLMYDRLFYQEQLFWLTDVLKNASDAGELVHIISHVGANHERCDRNWAMDLQRVIERFSHVIAGHFNGHSHIDEILLYRSSKDPNVALNVAWNGGSGTSFANLNSNFKFYYVDDQNYEVLDFETWIFNLNQANMAPGRQPNWYKEYSFKSYFNVPDLSPASINDLVKRFKDEKSWLRKYWEVTMKQSEVALKKGCDSTCLKNTLDSITRTTFPQSTFYRGGKLDTIKSVIHQPSHNKL